MAAAGPPPGSSGGEGPRRPAGAASGGGKAPALSCLTKFPIPARVPAKLDTTYAPDG